MDWGTSILQLMSVVSKKGTPSIRETKDSNFSRCLPSGIQFETRTPMEYSCEDLFHNYHTILCTCFLPMINFSSLELFILTECHTLHVARAIEALNSAIQILRQRQFGNGKYCTPFDWISWVIHMRAQEK